MKLAGPEKAPLIVLLHGFPEYWASWAGVARHLAQSYRVALPDQRGFNLSSKPEGVEEYDTKHMVADLRGLVDQLAPTKPVILCGHDWGASVAYAFAMRHADRVSKLVIANGVHPICFQKALYGNAVQREASQYINVLREEGSAKRLSRDNFGPLLNMFERFSAAPWLTEDTKDNYRAAWSEGGALDCMLNWYRASQMDVLDTEEPLRELTIADEMRAKYRIAMPHLLIWGQQDVALQPEAYEDLNQFCDRLTFIEKNDASHWILHEHPQWVAQQIEGFLTEGI